MARYTPTNPEAPQSLDSLPPSHRSSSDETGVLPDPLTIIAEAIGIRRQIGPFLRVPAEAKPGAEAAYHTERRRSLGEQLYDLPIEAVKDVTEGPLRLTAINSAGIRTVGQAMDRGRAGLEAIRGVGPGTSGKVMAGIGKIRKALERDNVVRFDVQRRSASQTTLLLRLQDLDLVHSRILPLVPLLERAQRIFAENIKPARMEYRKILRFFTTRKMKAKARAAFKRLVDFLNDPDTVAMLAEMAAISKRMAQLASRSEDVWEDYVSRPIVYNNLLLEVGGISLDKAASQGFLPDEIVRKVNGFTLDRTLLTASLRRYQAFGAKYALARERAILGDEMGLGKTVEALAVFCHLKARGSTHFFVVCPASVLSNWEHETRRHTRLSHIRRIHGPGRENVFRRWKDRGGVAITTFGTLGALDLSGVEIGAVVVDEAHYIKNPGAQRTRAVRSLLGKSEHLLLMTGTPMENRVEEFRVLVGHVRPDIAGGIASADAMAGADTFRKAVAPVYLRRNQEDVLRELPDKIEVEEWLTLNGPATKAYGSAVMGGNFMAMRRAVFMTERPMDSPKVRRMVEIAEEAMENGRKVVVFSFFRDVISRTVDVFGAAAFGPLTGSVSGPKRQAMLDEFSRSSRPGVLVSQIEAGGVGLNIQAASVVILTEPQWKPSTEVQAIARCHRMGQVRPVEVHRLLIEDSVDQHMRDVLSQKSALFAEYARKSDIKEAATEAIDSTPEGTPVSQTEQERRIIEHERRRLGVPV